MINTKTTEQIAKDWNKFHNSELADYLADAFDRIDHNVDKLDIYDNEDFKTRPEIVNMMILLLTDVKANGFKSMNCTPNMFQLAELNNVQYYAIDIMNAVIGLLDGFDIDELDDLDYFDNSDFIDDFYNKNDLFGLLSEYADKLKKVYYIEELDPREVITFVFFELIQQTPEDFKKFDDLFNDYDKLKISNPYEDLFDVVDYVNSFVVSFDALASFFNAVNYWNNHQSAFFEYFGDDYGNN